MKYLFLQQSIFDRPGFSRVNLWAWYIFVLLLPFSVAWPLGQPFIAGVFPLYVTPLLLLTDLGVITVILSSMLVWHRHSYPASDRFLPALLSLVVLALITLPFAVVPGLAVYTSIRWALAVLTYVLFVRHRIVYERVIWVLLIGMSLHTLVGIGQWLLGGPIGLPGEFAVSPNHPAAPLITTSSGAVSFRASGLTFNPNVLGGFLAVTILLSLPLLRYSTGRLIWWFLWIGVALSFSRSTWLTLLFTFPSATIWIIRQYPVLRRPIVHAVFGLGGILLICGVVLVEPLTVRMQPLESAVERGSLVGRTELVQVAIGSIAARPITGVGAGNFPAAVILTGTRVPPDHAHNVPLQMAAEIGVLGGGIWLWIWLSTGTRLWQYRHRATPWAIASGHAWFAIGIISLFDGYFWALDAGRLLTILTLALLTQTLEQQ